MPSEQRIVRLVNGPSMPEIIGELIAHFQAPNAVPMVLVHDLEGPDSRYIPALLDDAGQSAALLMGGAGPQAVVDRKTLVDVDLSASHAADTSASIIAIRLVPSDRDEIIAALRNLKQWHQDDREPETTLARLTFALVRGGVKLTAIDAYPWKPGYEKTASELRWRRAARGQDGLVSTLVLRPVSLRASQIAVRLGIPPNALTLISVALALGAALLLSTGERFWTAGAALLMYVSLVLDCSDGEVARFTGKASAVGGWLDGFTDRIKEHGLLIGLAFGAAQNGGDGWLAASIAVAVITARHIANFAFIDTVLRVQPAEVPVRSLDEPALPGSDSSEWKQRPGLKQTSARGWISRVLHAPVSERWAVLAIAALTLRPTWALGAYATYVGVSLLLTTVGWCLRTRQLATVLSGTKRADLVVIRDGYFTGRGSRWTWLLAPATVGIEFGAALAILAAADAVWAGPTVFLFIVAASWLRYERAYGLEYGRNGRIARFGGGWALRTVGAIALVALLQFETAAPVRAILTAGTAWLLLLVALAAVSTYTDLKQVKEAGR